MRRRAASENLPYTLAGVKGTCYRSVTMRLIPTTEILERYSLSTSAFWRIARARDMRPVRKVAGRAMWHPRQVAYLRPCPAGLPGQRAMAKLWPKIARDRHLWESAGR